MQSFTFERLLPRFANFVSTLFSAFQTKIAITGTAVQLASNALNTGVIITAKSTNTAPISVGISTVNNIVNGSGTGYILESGASVSLAITNTNLVYINGTANDIVSVIGA